MDTTTAHGQTTRPRAREDRTPALTAVGREHLRRPTVRLLALLTLVAVAARAGVGGWSRGDAVLVVVQVATFPLLEWVLHTALLHWRPRRLGRLTLDPQVARKHREHHADPRQLDLVFIPMPTLLLAVGATVAIGLLAFPRLALGLTFLAVQSTLGSVYEWTHHLVHTDYRPRTRLYRVIRRNHRLHHFKNEHYWFTVTTSGTADRLLGTCPDVTGVPTSPTARSLHGGV